MSVYHEGDKLQVAGVSPGADHLTVQEEWVKACDCSGTSSGPRVACEADPLVPGDPLKIRFVWCRIACDDCQKPWRKIEDPK